MKYPLEDKIEYFRAYIGQTVLNMGESDTLYPVTEEALSKVGDAEYLSLRPVSNMSAKESLTFYTHKQPGVQTTHENRRVWANAIANDLTAPNFDDGYTYLMFEGFLLPFASRSTARLVQLGWAKER